ncbi:SGNH/GDSL hydrolase family protein [Clostridium felsineum]|uniref:SGNH/GDSL hydrolase family protein n=1 Tax=Clostridium felsineum TaxID=36839 RepID=UPI00098CDC24|nr:SGNH/GDSL hydrolase family protein [Clostridium felsineum]URZ04192.1 hypothetical protein CLAUR_042800 [Clostridium felsineum]
MGNGVYKTDKKAIIIAFVLLIITVAVIISGIIQDSKREKDNEKIAYAYDKKHSGKEKSNKVQVKDKKEKDMKNIGKGKTIKYIAIGDSVTAGYSASSQDNFYVNKVGTLITANMGFQVQQNNMGKRGGVISDAINNVNAINNYAPDIVTIEYGTNDSNASNNISTNVFENELNTLIDDLTIKVKRTPTIILMTTWNTNYSEKYDEIIDKVGENRKIPVIDLKPIWTDKTNIGPEGNKGYYGISDNFNPNDKGMNSIASTVYGKLQPILYEKNK